MSTVVINYQLAGSKGEFLGSVERHHIPRVGDEMVMIPAGKKRAYMYRVTRVIWDEQPGAVEHAATKNGTPGAQCVDIMLEHV